MSNDFIGRTIGVYQVMEMLGAGGMGSVYRAYQTNLQREVALKLLSPGLATDAEYVERFIREAKTVAALEHTNIVPIYDYGSVDGTIYVAMRLLEGGTLRDFLVYCRKKDILPPLELATALLKKLGGALDYAHRKDIIHRDIKPGNIMFDDQGEPYLVDFGLAKIMSDISITTAGTALGTPTYMPPEQWQGQKVSGATDQYALGVLMFQMVTGQPPFEGDNPGALMYQHLDKIPPLAHMLNPSLPENVSTVISIALAKSPRERFSTVMAFAEAFEAACFSEGELPTTVAAMFKEISAAAMADHSLPNMITFEPLSQKTTTLEEQLSRSTQSLFAIDRGSPSVEKKRRSWGLLAAGIVLFLILGVVAFALFQSNGDSDTAEVATPTLEADTVGIALSEGTSLPTEMPTEIVTEEVATVTLPFSATPSTTSTITLTPSRTPTLTNTPSPTLTPTLRPTLAPGQVGFFFHGGERSLFAEDEIITATDGYAYLSINTINAVSDSNIHLQADSRVQIETVTDTQILLLLFEESEIFVQTGEYARGAEISLAAALEVQLSVEGSCMAIKPVSEKEIEVSCYEGTCTYKKIGEEGGTIIPQGQKLFLDLETLEGRTRNLSSQDADYYRRFLMQSGAGQQDYARCVQSYWRPTATPQPSPTYTASVLPTHTLIIMPTDTAQPSPRLPTRTRTIPPPPTKTPTDSSNTTPTPTHTPTQPSVIISPIPTITPSPILDSDGDGIPNGLDVCPQIHGDGSPNGCPDSDNDGIPFSQDQCPARHGDGSPNGCPDSDGDGIPFSQDQCPQQHGDGSPNGCPDSDGDSITFSQDQCPGQHGDGSPNGCPDSDGDGVPFSQDQCPMQPGPASNNGCPEGNEVPPVPPIPPPPAGGGSGSSGSAPN